MCSSFSAFFPMPKTSHFGLFGSLCEREKVATWLDEASSLCECIRDIGKYKTTTILLLLRRIRSSCQKNILLSGIWNWVMSSSPPGAVPDAALGDAHPADLLRAEDAELDALHALDGRLRVARVDRRHGGGRGEGGRGVTAGMKKKKKTSGPRTFCFIH